MKKAILPIILFWGLFGCTPPPKTANEKPVQIANPASENCVEKGGTSIPKTDRKGHTYSVCVFEDNRQCEEWAFFRGECQLPGRKITGYENQGQILCATKGGDVDMETKLCTLPDKKQCAINENSITCPEGTVSLRQLQYDKAQKEKSTE